MRIRLNTDGFTLVEVIISIAILSVASVVALQLFLTSKDLNTNSRQKDIASVHATNMLEAIRTFDTTADMILNVENMKEKGDSYEAIIHLDGVFEPTNTAETSMYTVVCQLTPTGKGLYEVSVQIDHMESGEALVTYKTTHYFKGEVHSDDL